MVAPRKHRNLEERKAICDTIQNKLSELSISEVEEAKVQDVLNVYMSQSAGAVVSGQIAFESIGMMFDYMLPGRRILQPLTRLSKAPASAAAETATADTTTSTVVNEKMEMITI